MRFNIVGTLIIVIQYNEYIFTVMNTTKYKEKYIKLR